MVERKRPQSSGAFVGAANVGTRGVTPQRAMRTHRVPKRNKGDKVRLDNAVTLGKSFGSQWAAPQLCLSTNFTLVHRPVMKDILVNNRYRVDRRIGKGGFGLVYAGTDTETQKEVALKLTRIRDGRDDLQYEADAYAALSGGVGIPRVLWFGEECEFYVLVHELLGPSLEDVFNYCDRKFSLKTVLLIADQTLRRLQYIHDKGYLHGDIKPDNFLLGVRTNGNVIYAIDFGLAKEFDATTGLGLRPLGGTTLYASLNHHNRLPQSRGDDLESLGYLLLYFARGSLPWQSLKAPTEDEEVELIKEMKTSMAIEDICSGLPAEFATYVTYARSLQPTEKPNFGYLLKLFNKLFAAQGFQHDNVFDWTIKRFNELHGSASSDEA